MRKQIPRKVCYFCGSQRQNVNSVHLKFESWRFPTYINPHMNKLRLVISESSMQPQIQISESFKSMSILVCTSGSGVVTTTCLLAVAKVRSLDYLNNQWYLKHQYFQIQTSSSYLNNWDGTSQLDVDWQTNITTAHLPTIAP